MKARESLKHPSVPMRQRWAFKLWLAGLVLLALPLIAYAFFGVVVSLMFSSLEGDEAIPKDQARQSLAAILKSNYGVTLEPDVEIVNARRTSGGFQGDGTTWYLIRTARSRAQRFEDNFTAHAGVQPVPRVLAPYLEPSIVKALGWRDGPPPGARIFKFNDSLGSAAIFFGDEFFYQNH